jgi:hypothetical protein
MAWGEGRVCGIAARGLIKAAKFVVPERPK